MSRLEIRIAHPDDRLNLIELQRRASLASETGEVRQMLIDDPGIIDLDEEMLANNEVFVAERGDRIVGFATVIAHEGNDAELEGLFVEPSEWRQGIATQLVRAVLREARAWGATRLHVMANPNVLGFYEANGFTRIGERKTQLGPMGILMVKSVVAP
jgi:GNAT superfamily N-acetyltransferase